MVNLELYRVFYTVAKCGSLTKAAQELYISQPAVSQAIKQFENQLGTSLFNRNHRGMDLSAGGKLIFKQVEDALNLLESAEYKLTEMRSVAEGTVRIGATDSIFYYLLADKIAEFNEKYPAVKLELISSTSPYTLQQLKDGKCDIAFVNLPINDKGVRFCGTVTHLNDIFVAGQKFYELKNTELSLKRLQEFPLLMIEENTVARKSLYSFTHTLGVNLQPDIEVANWDFMVKLAVKGMGIGCIPREYCMSQLQSGELFEVRTNPSLPVRGVGIALSENCPVSFAIKEFVSMFE